MTEETPYDTSSPRPNTSPPLHIAEFTSIGPSSPLHSVHSISLTKHLSVYFEDQKINGRSYVISNSNTLIVYTFPKMFPTKNSRHPTPGKGRSQ